MVASRENSHDRLWGNKRQSLLTHSLLTTFVSILDLKLQSTLQLLPQMHGQRSLRTLVLTVSPRLLSGITKQFRFVGRSALSSLFSSLVRFCLCCSR